MPSSPTNTKEQAVDHRAEAEWNAIEAASFLGSIGGVSGNGVEDYGPIALASAAIAQVHATLAVAEELRALVLMEAADQMEANQ